METTTVVITDSTRGPGLRLARELPRRGCAVMISGRTAEGVARAVSQLAEELPSADVYGFPCDTGIAAQVQALWTQAVKVLGKVDQCRVGESGS